MKCRVKAIPPIIVLALLLGACTTARSTAPDTSDPGTVGGGETTTTVEDAEIVGPTTRLVPDDARFLLVAKQELISRCMADRGFRYIVPTIPEDAFDEPPRQYWGPDPELASLVGYGIYDSQVANAPESPTDSVTNPDDDAPDFEGDIPPGEDTGDPNTDYLDSLSQEQVQEWLNALNGTGESQLVVEGAGELGDDMLVNDDGCEAEAETSLYGDRAALIGTELLIADLMGEQSERIEADPRLTQANDAWLRCMRNEGFEPDGPGDAYNIARDAYDVLPLEEARDFEIEIALVDLTCIEESGINRVHRTLEAEVGENLETEHAGVLLGLQEIQHDAVQRAKELLGES